MAADHIESTFEKLLGRQPSKKEVQNLYRVKNALGIHDNDALWMVLMALESYDALYRKYPALIASQLEDQRSVIAAMADSEIKKAVGSLAEAVTAASQASAVRLADAARWQSWGWAWCMFFAFGALCVFVGFVLGSGRVPYWRADPGQPPLTLILNTLARTPAGWLAAGGGAAAALASLWRLRHDVLRGHQRPLVAGALALLALSGALLWPVL